MNRQLTVIFTSIILLLVTNINAQQVKNAEEFIRAVGSNKTVTLQKAEFYLSEVLEQSEKTWLQECYDGNELVISDVENLTIKGQGELSHLIALPIYGYVIIFRNCTNITIENLKAGHGDNPGQCSGGVFAFENCRNITINNSVMYGSGIEGVTLTNTRNFKCINSEIKECTYSIMTLNNVRDVVFTNCKFHDNKEYDLINMQSAELVLNNCSITNNLNYIETAYIGEYSLFNMDSMSQVELNNCVIKNNKVGFFSNSQDIKFNKTDVEKNDFMISKYKTQ